MPAELSNVDLSGWEKILDRIEDLADAAVHVGVFSTGAGAASAQGGDITVAELAAVHEYGSRDGRIPERSYLRSTVRRQQPMLAALSERVARGYVDGKISLYQGLGLIGSKLAAEVKSTIRNQMTEGPGPQANAPSTIARKGSSTPLVDTGQLINAVTWEVEDRGVP